MEPLISIVTPTFNRRAALQRLLDALVDQTIPSSCFEVIVVDDGSTDGTVESIRRMVLPFTLRILEQGNHGPAVARNRGVVAARGQLILFLDDDVEPIPDLVAEHLAAHQGAPDLVVIGPMLPPLRWRRPIWVRWEEEKVLAQYRAMLAGEYDCTPRQLYTANASLPRASFLRAEGFRPDFRRAEDVELGYRLRDHGMQFVFNARAAVRHYAYRTFESWYNIPYDYGRFDVVMHLDRAETTLPAACCEFHRRHPASRYLAALCFGRPRLTTLAVTLLRGIVFGADGLGAQRIGSFALDAIFNLRYWQGVCDEFGDAGLIWRWISLRSSKCPERLAC